MRLVERSERREPAADLQIAEPIVHLAQVELLLDPLQALRDLSLTGQEFRSSQIRVKSEPDQESNQSQIRVKGQMLSREPGGLGVEMGDVGVGAAGAAVWGPNYIYPLPVCRTACTCSRGPLCSWGPICSWGPM